MAIGNHNTHDVRFTVLQHVRILLHLEIPQVQRNVRHGY